MFQHYLKMFQHYLKMFQHYLKMFQHYLKRQLSTVSINFFRKVPRQQVSFVRFVYCI